ncbi:MULTISPECIES: M48 family metallopeptidase [Flammeovirga]|uniref:M48 family metallopeptidase n=1 Tax=Flammeovirga agarivorans TaxID=2726742 RepID=A0A7X8XWM8_9BACT|nr:MULTISPECIES: M48 family metallopeptidase [Flammeovirga]NLR92447.1 M48 family metallopeptidase [Flammeovirga agarivorans]
MANQSLKIRKIHFKNIKAAAWEHPVDKVALKSLKKIKGLDTVVKFVISKSTEKSLRMMTLASSVRCNERQFPKIYQLLVECCQILDVEVIPEIYVSQSPILNAGALGVENPFIILNSSILETFNDDEIQAVIAHELGHILSGHVLYHTLLSILLKVSVVDLGIPLGNTALLGIIAGLKEWQRKSELSADRASLLVTQNPETSINLLMKTAGGNLIDQMNLGEFLQQAKEYEESNTMLDNTHKFFNTIFETHPFPVSRINELMKWVQSGEYDLILNGNYNLETDISYDSKEAKESYYDDFNQMSQPFVETAKQASDYIKNLYQNLKDKEE